METGSLDIRPSKIPAPDAEWLFPQTADFLAGWAVMAMVLLFAILFRRLSDDAATSASKGSPTSFEALRLECLEKISRANSRSEAFPEEIWDAVRHFLSASGRLAEAKNLTAYEFQKRFGSGSRLPEIAVLARDLSYAPATYKTPEGFEKLKNAARSAVKSVK